jgi:hypothetical protein
MSKRKSVKVVTWNLENMFHPKSGGPRNDFTPHEGWTLQLYNEKIKRLADVMLKIFKKHGTSSTPFVFGLTEIENEVVVNDLLKYLPARYKLAKDRTFRHKYFDTAIIYDSTYFSVKKAQYHQVFEKYPRGDVVQVDLVSRKSKEVLTVFCCHLKARPRNKYYTSMYREAVCDNMQTLIWKMHGGDKMLARVNRIKSKTTPVPKSLNLDKNIVVIGDFNDEPFSKSMMEYLLASYDKSFVLNQEDIYRVFLYNCSWEKLRSAKPGSLYYNKSHHSKWSMLDQIVISPALLKKDSKVQYKSGSFKVIQDLTAGKDGKPIRTNDWDDETDEVIWLEGYSDHFPVIAEFTFVG